jgi:ubiquinol-cytochrome c reductase cytochrome c subunit
MTTDRRSIGGWIALGVAALGALAVIGAVPVSLAASPGPSSSPTGQVTQAAAQGLYLQNCASCHGPQGQGTNVAPTLVGVGAASADFYLRTGRMPLGAPGQQAVRHDPIFSEAQIEALVAYVAGFGQGPDIPQVSAGGDVHEGWRLYTANCAACHAATGSGNAVGGGNVAVGLSRADDRTIAEATIIGPGAMPQFNFDQAQRDAIVAYVRYLQTSNAPGGLPIGGFGPVSEGFVAVVIGLVLAVLATRFVGRRQDDREERRNAEGATSDRPADSTGAEPAGPEATA